MGSFKTVLKLQKFLSKKNLELLDLVLSGIVEPKSTAFNGFWKYVMAARGNSVDDVTYTCKALEELRGILREYLAEGKLK